jgi:hypothetical protein
MDEGNPFFDRPFGEILGDEEDRLAARTRVPWPVTSEVDRLVGINPDEPNHVV